MQVTLWSKLNKKTSQYDYNHLEDGWCENDVPTPMIEKSLQADWKNSKWEKTHSYLVNGKVQEIK